MDCCNFCTPFERNQLQRSLSLFLFRLYSLLLDDDYFSHLGISLSVRLLLYRVKERMRDAIHVFVLAYMEHFK